MIQIFLDFDKSLFLAINNLPHNIFLDSFFSFFSIIGYWGIVWLVIGVIVFIWEEVRDKKGLIALIIALTISELLVEILFKNLFGRLRPQYNIIETIVIWDLSKSFSFPSGHATVAFAAAYILAKEHKKWRFFYYLLAMLISFSRVYLGKHYPSDVFAGAVLGMCIGYFSLRIIDMFTSKSKNH